MIGWSDGVVGIDVPGFGIPTHAEAKDVLAGAMLNYARQEVEAGPVAAPESGVSDRPTVTLLGEMFPADPVILERVVAKAFNQRRKMLRAALKGLAPDIEDRLIAAGIAPTDRAETVDLERFCALARGFES